MFTPLFILMNPLVILPLLNVVLIATKTALFVRNKTTNWRWAHIFYFSEKHIVRSSNFEQRTAKKVQNYLSTLILFVSVLYVFSRVINYFIQL